LFRGIFRESRTDPLPGSVRFVRVDTYGGQPDRDGLGHGGS